MFFVFLPSLSNIISISRLCIDNDILIQFFYFCFLIKDLQTQQLLLGTAKRGLYELSSSNSPYVFHLQTNKASSWHDRLGHPFMKVLQFLASLIPFVSKKQYSCNSCCISKSHKLPFYVSSITSNEPLQLLYSEVWSSLVKSYDDCKYYIICVDHFTKYI